MINNVIYKISNSVNEKIYIGSALNYNLRISKHINSLNLNKHHNRILQNHVNKYGINTLIFDIVEHILDSDNLIQREQFYIDTLKPEFNICRIAGNCAGRKWSDSMRKKMKGKKGGMLGKKASPETLKRMSEARTGVKLPPLTDERKKRLSDYFKENPVNYWKGKKRSEADKEKMRNVKLGKKASDETKKKMSEKRKGKKPYLMTEETKIRISLASKGRVASKETREKLRIASTGRIVSEETRLKLSLSKIGNTNGFKSLKNKIA